MFFLPAGITLHGPTNVVLNVSMREQFEGDTFSCQVRTNDFEPATRNTTITGEYSVERVAQYSGAYMFQ